MQVPVPWLLVATIFFVSARRMNCQIQLEFFFAQVQTGKIENSGSALVVKMNFTKSLVSQMFTEN